MATLVRLPSEALHEILRHLEPWDLPPVQRVCRYLYNYVKGNRALCRDIYLRTLDEPSCMDLDWEKEVKDLSFLMMAFGGPHREEIAMCLDERVPRAFETVMALLERTKSPFPCFEGEPDLVERRNIEFLRQWLSREDYVFMQNSFRLKTEGGYWKSNLPGFHSCLEDHLQRCAKVQSLSNMWIYNRRPLRNMYEQACSKVYDLREYTERTGWGPFRRDGSMRVDWVKVEALLVDMGYNMRSKGLNQSAIFSAIWGNPFPGTWPNSYVPWKEKDGQHHASEVDRRDPYGVSGIWVRVVCFLDYADFFAHNFPMDDETPGNYPRPPLNCGEATRVIVMKINAASVEPPGPEDGQELPVVHFRGASWSLHGGPGDNGTSDLKGTVRLTPEGEIRWTSFSVFNGEERWKSEGIQLGGLKSARGVVGTWFEKDMDPHGPCGPTSYWKLKDTTDDEEDVSAFMEQLVASFTRSRAIPTWTDIHTMDFDDDEDDEDFEDDGEDDGNTDGEDDIEEDGVDDLTDESMSEAHANA